MLSSPIVGFVLRGFQVLFGIVILGLSVGLIKGHEIGDLPVTLGFAAFVAGATLLGAFIGIASTWFEFLSGYVGSLVDGVTMLINIAGGVLIAIKLKGANCADKSNLNRFGRDPDKRLGGLSAIDILNGGCQKIKGELLCANRDGGESRWKYLNSRCQQSQADSVFMFLTVAVLLVCVLMTYLRLKKGY